jgi:sarcosine oxidase subunit alpha
MSTKNEHCTIHWNGRPVATRVGETAAEALFRAGHQQIASTRKRHRPLGLSGSFIQGVMAEVDDLPNVRLDQIAVAPGMRIQRQNTWPSPQFDLLKLFRLIPPRLVRGGFEHNRLFPSGTRRFHYWERLLAFLAGEGRLSLQPKGPAVVAGQHHASDVLVIGGGPAGIEAANRAAASNQRVILVTRGARLARSAVNFGLKVAALDSRVQHFTGHEACGIYRHGSLVIAAPHDGGPALAVECKQLILATGKRSMPPLVAGNALPGVMDAPTALGLAVGSAAAMGTIVVIGTEQRETVAAQLRRLGAAVAAVRPVGELQRILGTSQVSGAVFDQTNACQTVVHAGPWRSDPNLPFQAGSEGQLRLAPDELRAHIRVVGAAEAPDEEIHWHGDGDADVCPCMDVTAGEVAELVRAGVTHVEEIKRQTSAGMGPCQGYPCWELMNAVVKIAGGAAQITDRPSHRAPRRALTVAQAAGLTSIIDPVK